MPSNENFTLSDEIMAKIRNADPESAARIEQAMMSEAIRDRFDPVRQAVSQSASVDPYAPTAWGQPIEQDFTCPSGQVCRVRRVDIMDLLGGGLLNNLDFVTKIVQEEHIPNAAAGPKSTQAVQENAVKALASGGPEQMVEFKKAIDGVVLRVVVRPALWPVPEAGEPRVDGCVYVDSVSFTDKVEIFNWAVSGGQNAQEIKQFREEPVESLGAVESVEVVPAETVNLPQPVESD
jgi:hypothetical protein